MLESASETERPILEDGVITFAEYEGATLATVACYEQHGARVVSYPWLTRPSEPGLRLVGRGLYLYAAEDLDGLDVETSLAAARACEDSHSRVIQQAWFTGVWPTQEELQTHRNTVAECARQRGSNIPASPSQLDIEALAFPPDGRPMGRSFDSLYVECALPVILAQGLYTHGAGF